MTATVERRGRLLILRTSDGQEVHWPVELAALAVVALLSDGDVRARVRGES